jgi:hypothetical protein
MAHAVYYSKWYLPAIRELAASRGFRGDPAWIASHLTPPISKREARTAVDILPAFPDRYVEDRSLVRDADGGE